MQTGSRADLAGIRAAADRVGARVVLDATQAIPFTTPDEDLAAVDYVLVHGYKHLLCPRGVAFMILREDHVGPLPPIVSSWRASDNPYTKFFGGPLELADGAAQYDTSLAWHPWVGAAESLELLAQWQETGALEEPLSLARQLADRFDIPWGGATLVCPPIDDAERVKAALEEQGAKVDIK